MPLELTRRNLLAAGTLGTLAAVGLPATYTEAEAHPVPRDIIYGWGSSSLQFSPNGVNVLTEISRSLNRPAVNYARAGQTSVHSMVFRGYYALRLHLPNNTIPSHTRRFRINVDNIPYHSSMNVTGWINGVFCRVTSRGGHWYFERLHPGRATRITDNRFMTQAGRIAKPGRHIYWMGKNDLVWSQYSRQTAIDNTRRAWRMNTPQQWERNYILGQWATYRDSAKARADVAWMNRQYVYWFGSRYFLDVQKLLTTPWGLNSPPVRHLRILNNRTWASQARSGLPPRILVGPDGMHLSDLGNRIVAYATIPRLKLLGW